MTAPPTPGLFGGTLAADADTPDVQALVAGLLAPPPPPVPVPDDDARRRALLAAILGSDCPLVTGFDAEDAWVKWARGRWAAGDAMVQRHLWLSERNRKMRTGEQWISATGTGAAWRELPRAKQQARPVHNVLRPALDYRLQVLMEQRPGWKFEPATHDPDDQRVAQARQLLCESLWKAQRMLWVAREALYWAQTDGVAFWHTFWDANAGDPVPELQGTPAGDLRTVVMRVDQVRVARNATAVTPPAYIVIRESIPLAEAGRVYGADAADTRQSYGVVDSNDGSSGLGTTSFTPLADRDRLASTPTVEKLTVYCAPDPFALPEGLALVVLGNQVIVPPAPLPFGVVPVVPVRDGTTDPAFFPRPQMEDWIEHQQRVNAILQRFYENLRVNSGGRFIGRAGAIVKETFVGGTTSLIEVNAGEPASALIPMQGFSIGGDAKDALAFELKAIEQKSGWTDAARGSFDAGSSGRAILAQREQVERVFAPAVSALADAYTKWAEVQCAAAIQMYQLPRRLGVVGKQRPDLASAVTGQDFDGAVDVFVEPTSLMPTPQAWRQYQLDQMLQNGTMDAKEYRRRMPFSSTTDLQSPDEVQTAKACRVVQQLIGGQPPEPVVWQDDEAIHQDELERQIILTTGLPPQVMQAAQARWQQLAQQAAQKQGAPPPQAPGGQGAPEGGPDGAPSGVPGAATVDPSVVVPAMNNPAAGMSPAGGSQQEQAARQFEALSPQ